MPPTSAPSETVILLSISKSQTTPENAVPEIIGRHESARVDPGIKRIPPINVVETISEFLRDFMATIFVCNPGVY